MHSKHFCCCIPVRFGVWIMSLSTFLGWGAAAFLAFYSLAFVSQHPERFSVHISTGGKIGWGITGAIMAIFALISLFGFIGACIRNRNYVNNYKGLVLFMWIIDLFISIGLIALAFVIRSKKDLAAQCSNITINGTTINDTQDEVEQCQKAIQALQDTPFIAAWCIVIIVSLLWNLYGVIIVRRYVDQLDDEESYMGAAKGYQGSSSTVNVNLGAGGGGYGNQYRG